MDILFTVLGAVAAVVLIFGVCAIYRWAHKHRSEEKYDERQYIARGNGYRLAFFLGLFYYAGAACYMVIADATPIASAAITMAGLAVMVVALEIYCLMTHAAVARWVSPTQAMVGYLLLGGVHFGIALYRLTADRQRYKDVSWKYAYLFVAVCFLCLGISHLIVFLRRDKE